jgi:transposase
MPQIDDLSRSLTTLDENSTIIAVIEMSQARWRVAGIVPGVARHPLKKLEADETALLKLLHRWRAEADKAGCPITRMTVAYEAGRDGFWLAPHGSSPWAEGSRLQAHEVEAHVIHPTSVAVSREHRRAKTDRLDTALLKRAFLGWLRGERDHCSMVAIPTLAEEDAKRPSRERESLVGERTRLGNRIKATLARLGIRGFKPGLRKAKHWSGWLSCARQRGRRCRPIPWLSCIARSPGCASSVLAKAGIRSTRSKRRGANGWRSSPTKTTIQSSCCWPE